MILIMKRPYNNDHINNADDNNNGDDNNENENNENNNWYNQYDSIIFDLLFYSVTQRANHAKDYLLKEGLEKIDG